jgi:hypothetical protein
MEAKQQTFRLLIEPVALELAYHSSVTGSRTSTGLALMNTKRMVAQIKRNAPGSFYEGGNGKLADRRNRPMITRI